MGEGCKGREVGDSFWTMQQFTTVAGKPWFALQKQSDKGLLWQFTGYRHEIDRLCIKHGITPVRLPPTTEEEFFCRAAGDMPQEPTLKPTGLGIQWHLTN